jgi:hypothetical protein
MAAKLFRRSLTAKEVLRLRARPAAKPYRSTHPLFKSLTAKEVEKFERYAREHEPPRDGTLPICHPVCRAEWARLGKIPKEEET